MVNNNTTNKTTVNTGTKTESSIYLKKSELPKDVSSFRNDVGYISSSTLESWLKAHSYLSKTEIDKLIKNANLNVIDKINKQYDDDAIARLNDEITNMKCEINEIKDHLSEVESGFISIDNVSNFATKTQLTNLSNKVTTINNKVNQIGDTSTLAKKSDIPTKVSQLTNDAGYLTREQDLSSYAKKSDLTGFIKSSALQPFATKEWVNNQGFLKDSPDMSGFATKNWVEGQKYAKKSELGQYAKSYELSQYAKKDTVYTKDQINASFPTKKEVSDTYITKDEVRKGYLRIEDYRGLKDATVINNKYETLEELYGNLNNLVPGFYIVGQDVVIVKKTDGVNEVVSVFKDGIRQVQWEKEDWV